MYRHKQLSPLVIDKCSACQFCVWDTELHEYGCEIRDCFDGEKFVEYKGINNPNKERKEGSTK